MNPLIVFFLNHFVKLKFLDGYKMYGVGASMVFGGLGALAHKLAIGDYTIDDTATHAVELIMGGIGVIGAAGKADGLIAATKENTAVTAIVADRTASATLVAATKVADAQLVAANKVVDATKESNNVR